MVIILKTHYFLLSFLQESDLCISTAGKHVGIIKINYFLIIKTTMKHMVIYRDRPIIELEPLYFRPVSLIFPDSCSTDNNSSDIDIVDNSSNKIEKVR